MSRQRGSFHIESNALQEFDPSLIPPEGVFFTYVQQSYFSDKNQQETST
jgi:hypothetical protein